MFESATIRLTAWYLASLMVVSLLFSITLYHDSSNELGAGLRQQSTFFQEQPGFFGGQTPDWVTERQAELSNGQHHLLWTLIFTNLGILILGGFGSYILARRTLKPIEEAHEAQGRFTGDASHELRTPLTAMQTEIEVALRDKKLSLAQAKDLLSSNLEEVGKLRFLADGLLRLARQNGSDIVLEPVVLSKVAQEAVSSLAASAKKKGIKVDTQFDPIGPVSGDQASLVELAVILLDNAIKYSDPDSKIEVSISQRGKQGVLSVKDHGRGIQASDLPHIFDRFYRADTSRTKGSSTDGYGLGLSIAHQITELHNGVIEVSSIYGEGSVFMVRLPLSDLKQI